MKKYLFCLMFSILCIFGYAYGDYAITTIAGNGTQGFSGDLGSATTAQLNSPTAVAVDLLGNVYISDENNNRIREVNTSGIISTFLGGLSQPHGVAVDTSGNVYISNFDSNQIIEVSTSSIMSTYAGNGTQGYSGDGGSASLAELNLPWGVTADSLGNVYIGDGNNGNKSRVRKVNNAGIISTFAGNGTSGYSGDGGIATSAQLYSPYGLAVDASGNVYIADTNNNRIRKVDTSGVITTFAGNGTQGSSGDGGSATSAELYLPFGVAVDVSGNVYIADTFNNRIREVNTSGIITTFAGNGTQGNLGDGGSAISAELYQPQGVAVDASGNVYIADYGNNKIRKVFSQSIGGISGKVTRSDGTTGISGSIVAFYQNSGLIAFTTTDNGGNYSFILTTGAYTITASSSGYVTQTQSNVAVNAVQASTVTFALSASQVQDVLAVVSNSANTTVVIPTQSGNNSVLVPAGSFPTNVVLTVSAAAVPSAASQAAIKATAIGFDITNYQSLQPLKNFTITLYYSASNISGMNANNLAIAWYDASASKWAPLESTVNTAQSKITAEANHMGIFAIIELGSAQLASNVNNAYCFPSPVRFSSGQKLYFSNFAPNATIYILSTAGNVLKELNADANGAVPAWDGMTDNGEHMASGVYIVHAKDEKGNKKIFEIMVLK